MGEVPEEQIDAEFERYKWEAEFRLREREVAVKEQDAARQDREYDAKVRELDARLEEQKRARWTNPLVLAVFAAALAALGNAGVAYINGRSQHTLESDKNDAQITLERQKVEGQQTIEELKAEAARILEVIKTVDPDKAAENLDFLMKSGLIIDKKRREALERFLSNRKPGEGPSIPPVGPRPSINRPNYNLATPAKSPSQTSAAHRLLELAVSEINKNVDEESSAERITQYWGSVGMTSNIAVDRMPWSGAFLSWLINASGNKDHLILSAANIVIWNSAVAKRVTFLPGEKSVLPGDIAMFSRENSSGTNLDDLRAGKGSFTPSHPGIVYSSEADQLTTIEPNVGNGIRLRNYTVSTSKNIIGFIRLSDQ